MRGGEDNKEVLTEYTGTVPGSAVANVIPSADGDFDVTYSITPRASCARRRSRASSTPTATR